MNIPQRIKEITTERGWSEYRLVKESNLPASTIANIFHRGTIPSISTLESICHAFGITLSQFFSENDMVSLSAEQSMLLQQWGTLSSEQRHLLFELMQTMHT
ncbi:MAG: helix-turn-helix transcriptional regulator [Ruminococcus flavefaciens]|nr:helix-turn-helix transcriptional regulator [Ruminococcus flavefaciens]